MREIKFRAWYEREDFEHDENYMIDVHKIDHINEALTEINGTFLVGNTPEVINNTYAPAKLYLMQYTGLKDKNGVEVYINDIVEDEHGHRYEVVFEGDCLRCNGVRRVRGGHKPKNRWFGEGLKIIGNRYENPELLKEQNKLHRKMEMER